jgi:hypothetical protein
MALSTNRLVESMAEDGALTAAKSRLAPAASKAPRGGEHPGQVSIGPVESGGGTWRVIDDLDRLDRILG